MATWSQSPFLQALGWAMLNSVWQMALLFVVFNMHQYLISFSAQKKYYLALSFLATGFVWFSYTFHSFYQQGIQGSALWQHSQAPTSQIWNLILSAASIAYLLLLALPSYRLFKNWRYIEDLKKSGLEKTALDYQLFVKKVASQLGIRHNVRVYISRLVQSPVTIGYLKPIILLPLAAVTNLSTRQVEAVILHELAHIKRYDYAINFILAVLQTLFYFNPFVKKFINAIEFEREKSCDELVLQFQYDKISYASALLLLEKNLLSAEFLTVGAAGKRHLLQRIEKIVGREKKPTFNFDHFAGLFASFLLAMFINSAFFVNNQVKELSPVSFTAFENPLYQFDLPAVETFSKVQSPVKQKKMAAKLVLQSFEQNPLQSIYNAPQEDLSGNTLTYVTYNASEELRTEEEKEKIEQTIQTTKKVLAKTKWTEVENSIGDCMTTTEKKIAKQEYLHELEKIDWKKLENRLKMEYETLNWADIQAKLNSAETNIKLDSLHTTYRNILTVIEKTSYKENPECKEILPLPDASLQEVNIAAQNLRLKIDSIKMIRQWKIIDF